ncbi:MAG TPA: dTDP-4-dehydrorhamnose reductase [Anaeromyxobacter sp.]
MPRLLVIGGSGLVGTNLVLAARDHWETWATFCDHRVDFENVEEIRVDVRDFQQVQAVVRAVRPEVTVLTSAFMDVDGCERDPTKAKEVNTMGPKHVARAVKDTGLLIYISTDYVFDGKKAGRYSETDKPAPVNVYGQTKFAGEEEVRAAARDFLIVRPAQVWGVNKFVPKPTLVQKVAETLKAGREIELVSDQMQSPTYAPELARNLLDLVEAEARGVFHAGGGSALSRYEMGVAIADAYGLDSSLVRPVKLAAAGMPARRPENVVLSSTKMQETTGRPPALFESSLAAFVRGG